MLVYQRGPFQEIFLCCFRRCFAQALLRSWAGMECCAPKPVSPAALTASAACELGCLWLKACDGVSEATHTTWGRICSCSSFYGNPTLTGLASPWLSRGSPVPVPVPCCALGSRVVLASWLLVISVWGFRVTGTDTVVLRSLLHLFPSLGSTTLSPVPEQRDTSLLTPLKMLWSGSPGLQGWVEGHS